MTRRARLVPARQALCSVCEATWQRPVYLWHDDVTDTLLCGRCAGTITTGGQGDLLLSPALALVIERCRYCRRTWPALCTRHSREADGAQL